MVVVRQGGMAKVLILEQRRRGLGDVRIEGIIRCSCTHKNDLIIPKFNDTESRCTILFDL